MEKQKKDKETSLTENILLTCSQLAARIKARIVFTYLDSIDEPDVFKKIKLNHTELILVVRDETSQKLAKTLGYRNISVPPVSLTRMGQIKTAVLIAFSQRMLDTGDTFVFLVGPTEGQLDTMVVMRVGDEWEMFQSIDQPKLTEHIKRVVFQRVLTIALELAAEGREGKPIGTLFVLGDDRNVSQYCRQIILNPFKGYDENQRNILDESMRETIKSFSTLDGAFVIKGNGIIVSAGTHLKGVKASEPLPQGLGSRHASAAGITASTKSIAITISESTGTVRIWRRGEMITEIEKLTPTHHTGPISSTD